MLFKDIPIRRKLMRVILLVSGIVSLITCASFLVYEFYTFRQTTIQKLFTLGEIIATNSTAALAFDSRDDAKEILTALKAEPHIVAARLYDKQGNPFSQYVATPTDINTLPGKPGPEGYRFVHSYLQGFQPVTLGDRELGTLYLKSDLGAIYERFARYGVITGLVIALSFLLAYFLSRIFQKNISNPILALAETAKVVSKKRDYSVRAVKTSNDELGSLTDAFNHMLVRIEEQNKSLSKFNQKLEQKVSERTLELETVNRELEAFSYSVSHDLRAPLRAINAYSGIIEEEYDAQLDDEMKRLLGIIKDNAKRMGTLIDDLLAFSRLGRKEIAKTLVDFNQLVNKALQNLDADSKRKVQISVGYLKPAYGDPALLYQVFENLISNAIKYSAKKTTPEVNIGFWENEEEYIYYVKDNGAGFNMEYAHKLFGIFQRLHNSQEFEGTGVGLAIVQRIIIKHEGRVWAEAQVDKGATFYFSLPKPLAVISEG